MSKSKIISLESCHPDSETDRQTQPTDCSTRTTKVIDEYISSHVQWRDISEPFCILLSPVRLSSVCLSVGNARAPYSGGWNFRQYFYGVWYDGHPLTSTKNFTKIVPGEPLRLGI